MAVAVVGVVAVLGVLALGLGGGPEDVATADVASTAPALDLDDLADVCRGEGGEPGTAERSTDPGLHPMAVFSGSDRTWERVDSPFDGGGEASEIETVACRSPLGEPRLVGQCDYSVNGGHITLNAFANDTNVRVLAARSGELLAEQGFLVTDTTCPDYTWLEPGMDGIELFPTAEIRGFLAPLTGDGTRPDLSVDVQLEAMCRRDPTVARVADAPAVPTAPATIAVIASHLVDFEIGLVGADTSTVMAATHLLCLGRHPNIGSEDGCAAIEARLVRLADGAELPVRFDGRSVTHVGTCVDAEHTDELSFATALLGLAT